MGSGKDSLVAEPIQKIIHKMGEKAPELYCNATFRMCMDNFQISRAFRIGSKSEALLPVFEAVINSIHAIEDRKYIERGG